MNNEWKPIDTAPASGEFLVRGGQLESELYAPDPYTVAHVERHVEQDYFPVCNTVVYSAWVKNPTEWKPI